MKKTYSTRTPESIQAELDSYTEDGVQQLAKFLQAFMANAHNGRDFIALAKDKSDPPHVRIRLILGHAYDWVRFGN